MNVSFGIVLDEEIKNKPFLLVYEDGLDGYSRTQRGQKRIDPIFSDANAFFFELKDQTKPLYFSLLLVAERMDLTAVREFHFEPGDRVRIELKRTNVPLIYDIDFSGAGSAKYSCLNAFKYAVHTDTLNDAGDEKGHHQYSNKISFRYVDMLYEQMVKYKKGMSDYSYHLLNADVMGKLGKDLFSGLEGRLKVLLAKKDKTGFRDLSHDFLVTFKFDFVKDIPVQILLDSKEYASFLLARIRAEVIIKYAHLNERAIYDELEKIEPTALKDKMMMIFLDAIS